MDCSFLIMMNALFAFSCSKNMVLTHKEHQYEASHHLSTPHIHPYSFCSYIDLWLDFQIFTFFLTFSKKQTLIGSELLMLWNFTKHCPALQKRTDQWLDFLQMSIHNSYTVFNHMGNNDNEMINCLLFPSVSMTKWKPGSITRQYHAEKIPPQCDNK